ncbi:MAG: YHS domain protein [Boseongicola sp.]|nr:YHS domain protein [Boseongicola sp.]MXW85225.1 YHS domain protein [Boseongicola sp. SB0667_bin_21]
MQTRRLFLSLSAAAFLAGSIGVLPARAAQPPVFATNGVAIHGYDPVAYFTMSKPVEGDAAITSVLEGATFRFASAEHKALFDADPEKYAPKYGGYCAYAVSKGATATTVPEAWSIHDGQLYLNYSAGVHRTWLKDVEGNIQRADANWPGVLGP